MANVLERKMARALEQRRQRGTLRTLKVYPRDAIDFYSNDYLGIAQSSALNQLVTARKEAMQCHQALGATGSRLISGNSSYFMQVEQQLAAFYNSDSALLFNSGYAANLGVLSSLPQSNDWVLFDELIHNSCHEGLRLSRAYAAGHTQSFRHNDIRHLRGQLDDLQTKDGSDRCVFVVIESLYSMDGDEAPLEQLVRVCREFPNTYVIIDEAHAVGVYGPNGSGLVRAYGLDDSGADVICCRVYTFGKAVGCHGAVVCGSETLKQYLVNYARSFIYTTAFPFDQLVTIECAHEFLAQADETRRRLRGLVGYFKQRVQAHMTWIPPSAMLPSQSPIQGIVFAGNGNVIKAAQEMQARGICIVPIRSPTVPKGKERFRIIVHANNTEAQIDQLVQALVEVFKARADGGSSAKL